MAPQRPDFDPLVFGNTCRPSCRTTVGYASPIIIHRENTASRSQAPKENPSHSKPQRSSSLITRELPMASSGSYCAGAALLTKRCHHRQQTTSSVSRRGVRKLRASPQDEDHAQSTVSIAHNIFRNPMRSSRQESDAPSSETARRPREQGQDSHQLAKPRNMRAIILRTVYIR